MNRFILSTGILLALVGCREAPQKSQADPTPVCGVDIYCPPDPEPRPCGEGEWDHDGDPLTNCVRWTACDFQEEQIPGSATADAQCRACLPDEHFTDGRCVRFPACQPGTHRAEDGGCPTCVPQTYSSTVDATRCEPWTRCVPGEAPVQPPSPTRDVTCEACGPGSYCPGGLTQALPCSAGAWDDDLNPLTACVLATQCVPTQIVVESPTSTSDRVCAACPAGQSSLEMNASACHVPCVDAFGVTCQEFHDAYLKPTPSEPGDHFGASVAISGDTIVVGAPGESTVAAGSGSVFVFVRFGNAWMQQAQLKASNPDIDDAFGQAVGIAGDTLIVGAPHEDSEAREIDGDQTSNRQSDSGAVYVFERSGTTWTQTAYIKPANSDGGQLFGSTVAMDGQTFVAGAPGDSRTAGGVDSASLNTGAARSGAAYVFAHTNGVWSQQADLKAADAAANDDFGISVAIHADRVAVGAPGEDSPSANTPFDLGRASSGAVYVFERTGVKWAQTAMVKATAPRMRQRLGIAVAVDDDELAVGSDFTEVQGGAVFYFRPAQERWAQFAIVQPAYHEAADRVGFAVALHDGKIFATAPFEESSATGVDGDSSDNSADSSGAVYAFQGALTQWKTAAYIKADNADADDQFGTSMAIDGDFLIVGAPFEDGEGNPFANTAIDSGAVYVRRIAP
ncbi:MAG: hypothetical protein R3E66_20630 [bacterium]